MSHDYLWDRSGDQDPEIERLEEVLRPLAHTPRTLDHAAAGPARSAPRVPARRAWAPLAAAAALVLVAGGAWWALRAPTPQRTAVHGQPGPWTVEPLQGTPTVGAQGVQRSVRIGPDEWLETDERSGARLQANEVGVIDVGPDTRVSLTTTRAGEHRFRLARGILHASIWAPPGQFYVETPSATAVDLGCSYSLEVDEDGAGTLRVTSGWVGLERRGRRSLVPAGATCAVRPGQGPGTPRFEDAGARFAGALDALEEGGAEARHPALETLLGEARARDAFTLWHLLDRVDRGSAALVYDRLAVLAPPPATVARGNVLAGDRAALDAWWNSLGLGDSTWFRVFTDRPVAGAE